MLLTSVYKIKQKHISTYSEAISSKANLQKEGIFFLIHLFARDILFVKKLEIEETKTTQ